jgi:isochorismate synthase EntC
VHLDKMVIVGESGSSILLSLSDCVKTKIKDQQQKNKQTNNKQTNKQKKLRPTMTSLSPIDNSKFWLFTNPNEFLQNENKKPNYFRIFSTFQPAHSVQKKNQKNRENCKLRRKERFLTVCVVVQYLETGHGKGKSEL